MSKLETQLKKATKHMVLVEEDKALMRERLVSYMEHKPLRREPVHGRRAATRLPLFGFFRTHHLSGALVIALLATTSTFGMSFAAGDALPGDLLYPVKVNVNEEVKGAFKISHESRIEFEQTRAELRLKEASQLASEGRLDSKKQEAVAKLFAEHTEAVTEQVQEVEESDPVLAAEVSTEFEAALDTHEAVLARLIVEGDDEGNKGAQQLVEQVRTAANEAEKLREEAEERMTDDEPVQEEPVAVDATQDVEIEQDHATPKTE